MESKEHQAEITVREAGRLGGLTTLSRYGIKHYREAGRKGQTSFAAKSTPDQRQQWGKLGGRPPKKRYQIAGEKGQ